jgi:hypothetical protein
MKIERIDRWVKEGKIERRVRTYKFNGVEYKLLRDAKAARAAAQPKKIDVRGGYAGEGPDYRADDMSFTEFRPQLRDGWVRGVCTESFEARHHLGPFTVSQDSAGRWTVSEVAPRFVPVPADIWAHWEGRSYKKLGTAKLAVERMVYRNRPFYELQQSEGR